MSLTRSLWYPVLVLSLGTAACTREAGFVPTAASRLAVASRLAAPAMMSTGVAYGVAGIRPATGRSGSAAITAMAVYHAGGTVVTVLSYAAADTAWAVPAGSIDKLLVKAFGAGGALLWTRNLNHLAPAASIRSFTVAGLEPGMRVVVQANVTAIDPRRTDVVTAAAAVVARPPNLAVGPVSVQARWQQDLPFPVSATVTETGGDVSVRASCVLYVDGVKADEIGNMFVGAGDHVACNFSTSIAAVGPHAVTVAVENMLPGDDNPLDNQATARVDITPSGVLPSFTYEAAIGDVVVDDYDSTYTKVTNLADGSVAGIEAYVDADSGHQQSTTFAGLYYGQAAFPLARLVLNQSSGGAVLDADTLTNLPENGLGSVPCTVGTTAGGSSYSLCTYPAGYTVLQYTRLGGLVSYRSQSYNLMYDPTACTSADGCWVDLRTAGVGVLAPWSDSLKFDVAITSGDTVYAASPSLPLAPVDSASSYGPTCSTAIVNTQVPGPFGVIITVQQSQYTCVTGHHSARGVAGSGSGVGVTLLTPTP